MSVINQIKAEIERRWKDYRNSVTPDQPKYRTHYFVGKGEVCEELLSFLDTLEEPDRPEPYTGKYDEAYLNEKIKKASEHWKGVDVDKYMDEVRGEEPVCEGLNDEIYKEKAKVDRLFGGVTGEQDRALIEFARHFAQWGAEHLKK